MIGKRLRISRMCAGRKPTPWLGLTVSLALSLVLALPAIVAYVCDQIPEDARGSYAAIDRYLDRRAGERRQAEGAL